MAEQESRKKGTTKSFVIEVIIVVALLFAMLVLVKPTIVKQTSMLPNLQNNNYLLLSKQAYRFGKPERGQIVVFPTTGTDGSRELYIKRVIGLPGDRIEIRNEEVYINGKKEDQSFTADGYTPYMGGKKGDESELDVTVPEGELFVMGDNRVVSRDSRVIGTVKASDVVGVVFFRLWPLNKIGTLEKYR